MNDALRLLRVFNDMKSYELAEKLEISTSYLSEIEKGKKKISIELLDKYASVFGTTSSALFAFVKEYDKKDGKIRNIFRNKIIDVLQNVEKYANEES
ncbi:helix-turn-helix domain-containing protein [Breznakiella homolactica]|uniref:Helix-turn-helix transcriptional regulator n=1 Tax=Breznakiella homolactica TaxID=2798577 RepID=A0A7T7XNM9_9SPIR|nr:helix-turn-helix transcriptional regulator [Breznakiella homolactica]QQO09582.1 helix-turn-helix transcriptional regulator [Breznakiella homolactica]